MAEHIEPHERNDTSMKLYKSLKEPEIYLYFNANKEKLWMF